MAGYSQSGVDTATYAMAIHPLSFLPNGMPVFDGYLPNAHSGSIAPLQSGDSVLPALESAAMTPVAVPVVDVETQTDVEGLTFDRGEELPTSTSVVPTSGDPTATTRRTVFASTRSPELLTSG
jgi:Alpha/beta hydrolase domain